VISVRTAALVAGGSLAIALLSACAPAVTSASPSARVSHLSPTPAATTTAGTSPAPTSAPPSSATATPTSATPTSASPSDTTGAGDPTLPSPSDTSATTSADGLIPVLHRIDTTDPVVFITIDDGYDKDPRVVALLQSRHIPVTPFLTVDAIKDKPSFFVKVQNASGQSVEDHTLTHPKLSTLGYDAQVREICGAATTLQGYFGQKPWLFRPPYGDYDRTTRREAASCGMKALVLWDVSLPHAVLRYANGSVLHRGDIILIHWRPNLYRDLPVALDAAAAQGLRVAALQDYLPQT
jgi:peptidoglycan/xylan/chitin deacetylase (PgdA/CDA1 family)